MHLEDERKLQSEEKVGIRKRGRGRSCTDKSSNTRGQSARLNEPAEVQNGFYHNETITLTKDPVFRRSDAIMLKEKGQFFYRFAVNLAVS